MRGAEARTALPRSFGQLARKQDILDIFRDRHSARVYTQQPVTLLQLSFLLWATQGREGRARQGVATLRTVPSGGARHGFETYLLVPAAEGLAPGAYHYLPMEHALELLHPVDALPGAIAGSLCGRAWAGRASVVFYRSFVPYRCEWRYDTRAHRPALIDAGHVGQNLYLACDALRLGACAIAAFDHDACCRLFELDGEEELPVYAAPVGTVRAEDRQAEHAFYSFVEEQGL